jgi:hypothetical protein
MSTVTLTEKVRFYESVFGAGRMARNCKNFDVRCPICAPKDASKKKLAILVEDDRCHCWVCGYKSRTLAPLIRKYGTRDQLVEYRDRFMPESEASYRSRCVQVWLGEDKEPERLRLPKDFRLLVTASDRDPDILAIKKYLYFDRKLTDDDLWFFKIGYSNQSKWIRRAIVPSFDKDGELNHYVGRTVDKYKKPKYEAPEGERKQVIFNEINVDWSRRLVVCEGVFDLIKCGDNAVPLLGSDLNEESALFNAIVANETPVALALDADMKVKKTPRIAQKLMDYNIDVLIVSVPTDPGDMTKQDFRRALKAAQPFDWHQSFLDKLDQAARVSL